MNTIIGIIMFILICIFCGCGKSEPMGNTKSTYWVGPTTEYVCTGNASIQYVNGVCTCSQPTGYQEGCFITHPSATGDLLQ